MGPRKRGRLGKKSRGLWGILFVLVGLLAYHFSPLITGSRPSPHGPFPVEKVRAAPVPALEAKEANLDGVLVWLEGPLVKKRRTRGGTFLLWIDGFKVVAYPFIARDLEGSFLEKGLRLKVVGVLRDHPRYGWEVILRRPSDLQPALPAS